MQTNTDTQLPRHRTLRIVLAWAGLAIALVLIIRGSYVLATGASDTMGWIALLVCGIALIPVHIYTLRALRKRT